jgi:photosystem II stability/assembly factor-like uncharacterized protein
MIRIHQADRSGAAMQGQTSSWSWRWGSGSPVDLSGQGSTALGMASWGGSPMYQSVDSGATFVSIPEPGDYTQVAVASSTVAWRTGLDGIQRSLDANAAIPTWTDVTGTLPGGCINVTDIDAVSAANAWLLCGDDAYRSNDSGATWNNGGFAGANADRIDAISTTTAFAIGYGVLRRSVDSNLSWGVSMTGIIAGRWMVDVSGSPITSSVVWSVDTSGQAYRSTDAGATWIPTATVAETFEAIRIAAISDTSALMVGYDGMAYRTIDSGATWTRLPIPNNGAVMHVAVLDASHFMVGSNDGSTFATTDGGTTWVNAVDARDAASDTDAVDDGTILTSDAFGKTDLSTDGGASWSRFDTGIAPYAVRGVALHASGADDGTQLLFAVGDVGSIAISRNGGSSWSQPASGTAQNLWDIDVRSDGVALAVGGSGTILRSTDWGSTWTSVGAATATLRRVSLRHGGIAFAVGLGGLVRRSTDSGATWTTIASGTTADLVDLAVTSDEVAYASGFETLVKTIDGGASWAPINTLAANSVWGTTRVAAASDDTVWLFQSMIGGWTPSWAMRSTDGGQTWSQPFTNHEPGITSPIALDTGVILMPGEGGDLRVTDPASEVADYAAGSWAGGTARFGFCVQDRVGADAGVYARDDDGVCDLGDVAEDDAAHWNPVPITPTKLASIASAGTGSVDLVWGLHVDSSVTPGEYTAGIVITAVAPDT